MAKLTPFPTGQELDDNGNPLAGGLVYTYEAGTSTPKATYTDASEDTPNANPVVLDSAGRGEIWLGDGAYYIVLKDALGNLIDERDNLTGNATGAAVSYDISTNTLITTEYENARIYCTSSPTLSLLAVADAGDGFEFMVYNDGAGTVTIDPDSAETINGSASLSLSPEQWARISCDGGEWYAFADTVISGADNTFSGDNTFTGKVSVDGATELTISSGAITATKSVHTIDTEGDASSDDLETITGTDGQVLIIRAENAARTVVVKHDTGNILTPNGEDIELNETSKALTLRYDSGLDYWLVISSPELPEIGRAETFDPLNRPILSNGTDTEHDIDISAGSRISSDKSTVLNLTTGLTKQADASWAAGTNAGGLSSSLTLSNNTWYHVFLIKVAGSVDVGFDTSVTAANLITDHSATSYRRIGSFKTDGSANIVQFIQKGNKFTWDVPVQDTTTAPTTTAALITLTVPTGVSVDAIIVNGMGLASSTAQTYSLITNPSQTDSAVSATVFNHYVRITGAGNQNSSSTVMEVGTNTSGQVRQRSNRTPDEWFINTIGWVDEV